MASFIDIRTGKERNLPVLIKESGFISEWKDSGDQLESLKKAVGGYIETVPVRPWRKVVMVVDEEGVLKGKGINIIASEMAGQPIVGDVVLVEYDKLK